MKKQIARWLIISLGMSGTAWAQDVRMAPICGIEWEQWKGLSLDEQVVACTHERGAQAQRDAALASAPAPTTETRATSQGLGIAGLVTMAAGIVMVAPRGEQVDVLGTSYCVTNDYKRVEAGSCNNPASVIKAGLAVIGIGAVLSYIGFRSKTVAINPQLSPSSAGATVRVKW